MSTSGHLNSIAVDAPMDAQAFIEEVNKERKLAEPLPPQVRETYDKYKPNMLNAMNPMAAMMMMGGGRRSANMAATQMSMFAAVNNAQAMQAGGVGGIQMANMSGNQAMFGNQAMGMKINAAAAASTVAAPTNAGLNNLNMSNMTPAQMQAQMLAMQQQMVMMQQQQMAMQQQQGRVPPLVAMPVAPEMGAMTVQQPSAPELMKR